MHDHICSWYCFNIDIFHTSPLILVHPSYKKRVLLRICLYLNEPIGNCVTTCREGINSALII